MKPSEPSAGVHPAIRAHLLRQGISTSREIESFLFPKLSDLPSPFLLKSMTEAVDLVWEAIRAGHDIVIWGDYDVDGITATALLALFFRQIGISVVCHIPDRLTEGYGLNEAKLRDLASAARQEKLLITVDCGIANQQEILVAKELGFKVIVTDHHQVPSGPLAADAAINPKQKGCAFPDKNLAGVGIAFYFAAGIRAELEKNNFKYPDNSKPNMKSFLGLVAMGTIADVMPLTGANRLLAKAGFEALANEGSNGLGVLFDELGIERRQLYAESVSFQVAPAINAAGRLGQPRTALDLLTSCAAEHSRHLAAKLKTLNSKRKTLGKIDLENALPLATKILNNGPKCIVIQGSFHDGLLGITASRLVEIYRVPVIVCCPHQRDDRQIKGSARAPAGFNLFAALSACSHFLIRFGGHEAAAGIVLHRDAFEVFKEEFDVIVSRQRTELKADNRNDPLQAPHLTISEALHPVLLANLHQLEPVGEGNPKPVFIDEDVRFVTMSFFGPRNEHFRGTVRGKYENIPVVGFNIGERAQGVDFRRSCCLRYTHMFDTYNKSGTWKIRVEDIWQNTQL